MSNFADGSLLFDDETDDVISKWDHFKIISYRIRKNVNWWIVFATIIASISLSIICSGVITNFVDHHLHTNSPFYLDEVIIHRNMLSKSDNNEELKRKLKDEKDLVGVLEGDIG